MSSEPNDLQRLVGASVEAAVQLLSKDRYADRQLDEPFGMPGERRVFA